MAQSPLENALEFYQLLRHIGESVLIAGLVCEILVVAFLHGTGRHEIRASVAAVIVIIAGVGLENFASGRGDEVVRIMRAPRTLTAQSANRIAGKLRPFAGTRFDVAIDPMVEVDFMFAIMGAISSGEWTRVDYPGSNSAFPLGVGIIVTHPGLQIRIDGSRQQQFLPAARALADAFATEGVPAPLIIEYPNSEAAPDVIHLELGRKS